MLDDVTEEEKAQWRREAMIILAASAALTIGLITMLFDVKVGGTIVFISVLGMLSGILSMLNE